MTHLPPSSASRIRAGGFPVGFLNHLSLLTFLAVDVASVASCTPENNASSPHDASLADSTADAGPPHADAKVVDAKVVDQAIRPDTLVQTIPTLGDVTLYVNIGDSIAAGYGVPRSFSDLLYENDDATYPAFAKKDLKTRYPGLTRIDRAVPGSTSNQVIPQLANVPDNLSGHTLVTVSAGGNDLLFNAAAISSEKNVKAFAQQVTTNLQKIVDHFQDKTRYPGGATIVFFNLYDPTDATGTIPLDAPVVGQCAQYHDMINLIGPVLIKQLAVYDQALAAFAKKTQDTLMADMHGAFLGHGYHHNDPAAPFYASADPSLWFAYDCIHPNQDGHRGLRRLILQLLFGAS